jgi:hypothetical protein
MLSIVSSLLILFSVSSVDQAGDRVSPLRSGQDTLIIAANVYCPSCEDEASMQEGVKQQLASFVSRRGSPALGPTYIFWVSVFIQKVPAADGTPLGWAYAIGANLEVDGVLTDNFPGVMLTTKPLQAELRLQDAVVDHIVELFRLEYSLQ